MESINSKQQEGNEMTKSSKKQGFGNVGKILICVWQPKGRPHLYAMRLAEYFALPSNQDL